MNESDDTKFSGPSPDRRTIVELVETEIRVAANSFADELAPELSKQIADQIEEKVNEFVQASDGGLEKEARDLIQPAFMAKVYARLGHLLAQQHNGWAGIYWSNMNERYDETGEV